MKKLTTTTISISLVLILLLGLGSYYMFGHGVFSKTPMLYNTSEPDGIVKGYLITMIPRDIEVVDASKKIMNDIDITIPQVRLLAARITDAQEFEIGQLKSWYTEWFKDSVPLFLYERKMRLNEGTGDAAAKIYLEDMIAHFSDDVAEGNKARAYIEAIQKKSASSDGQLTITNSHIGIDTIITNTLITEEKRQALIGEMEDLLKTL